MTSNMLTRTYNWHHTDPNSSDPITVFFLWNKEKQSFKLWETHKYKSINWISYFHRIDIVENQLLDTIYETFDFVRCAHIHKKLQIMIHKLHKTRIRSPKHGKIKLYNLWNKEMIKLFVCQLDVLFQPTCNLKCFKSVYLYK